ncbi:S-arrestin-like isoform X2 [Lates japonicus]|uniref:S-arrestin n=1 Tax=Lates japonicus TaxID=270547 RepID=A0AAD3MAQ4_LATJO|nr:S-arrestin-like isoform X2 [Lates japonicus]
MFEGFLCVSFFLSGTADSLPSICTNMSPKNIVFKKVCKDKSVAVYMGKRDFVDHVDSVDPVDGVILVDLEALQGRKVFVTLSCTFRYGRDDMDVMGIAFRRELFLSTRQVYPPLQDREKGIHTKTQARLLRKLGENAYPFFFESSHWYYYPAILPICSTVHLALPHMQRMPTSAHLTLLKHWVPPSVLIVLTVRALARLPNPTSPAVSPRATRVCDCRDTVSAGATLQKEYKLLPLLANNRERRGIALDGKLKHEDTNLASSSMIKEGVQKEVLGIMVSYRVMVKLIVGGMMGSSEVGLEVPFKLMHPKPDAVKESEMEEEMVFQEFKRSYLKGIIADDEDEEGNVSGGDDMAPKEK